jgi:WhiB family transcriptional regulator, redox-sensing transcriptional regulator
MTWRYRAACRDEEPDLFFPIGNSGPALGQLAEAKSVCRACPVVGECLAWAMETGQGSGVWGGMSEDERRELRRAQSRSTVSGTAGVRVLVGPRPRRGPWA